VWWYLLQGSIVFAVIWSDIRYHWSPEPSGAVFIVFCAFAATALLGDLFRFLRWLLKWKRSTKPRWAPPRRPPIAMPRRGAQVGVSRRVDQDRAAVDDTR
jgi:hypothetical protein